MGLLFQSRRTTIRERWDYCAVMIVISANCVYHMLVLSSVRNLKSVRFFNLVLQYDYWQFGNHNAA